MNFHGRRETVFSGVPRKWYVHHQQTKAEIRQAAAVEVEEATPGRAEVGGSPLLTIALHGSTPPFGQLLLNVSIP